MIKAKEIKGVTSKDIDKIQVLLELKDGRVLVGITDNEIIKNIMTEFVKFAEVKPECIQTIKTSDIVVSYE